MADVELNQIRFEDLQGGGAIEELNAALDRVLQDCGDPNTVPGSVRKVTLTIAVRPDKGLTRVVVSTQVVTKLAQPEPVEGMILLAATRGRRVVGIEPQQQTLDETAAGPIGIAARKA